MQSYQEPDEESLEAEAVFTELREEVILNIQPTHAIMYDSYNLCELMNEGQLSKFAISMLEYVSSLKFQRLTSKAKEKPHTKSDRRVSEKMQLFQLLQCFSVLSYLQPK